MAVSEGARNCIVNAEFGGLGIHTDQPLLRVIGSLVELSELLAGRLSFTRASDFADQLEAFPTIGEVRSQEDWWGTSWSFAKRRLDRKLDDIRAETHVSCWHQLTKKSELRRLLDSYTSSNGEEKDFWCVVGTSAVPLRTSLDSSMPKEPWYIDFGRVRYIQRESGSLVEAFSGSPPHVTYPQLFCKRANWAWENEARLVMHDWGAATVSPGPRRSRGLAPLSRWIYATVDPLVLVETIWFARPDCYESALAACPKLKDMPNIQLRHRDEIIRLLMDKAIDQVPFPDMDGSVTA
jgi:hypothetical protein